MANAAELKPHPRLWWPSWAEGQAKEKIAADPLVGKWNEQAMRKAGKILGDRTCRYDIPDGKRLLGESRLAIFNVLHTAWAWRITGEQRYFDRCVKELDAASALKDWNTSHFLDTAEMATAVAVGYDWLWPKLSEEQRQRYARAIIDKALRPAKGVYDKKSWWSRPGNNWSQVCGAGIALGAAAVEEHEPALCKELWDRGTVLIGQCKKFYEPDGCYPEGPGYWQYGTSYHVLMLSAAQLLDRPAELPGVLRLAGDFILQMAGPSGLSFNFADAGAGRSSVSPAQVWIASQFRDPVQAGHLRARIEATGAAVAEDRFGPLGVLWMPEALPSVPPMPVAVVYGGEQAVASLRTGWGKDAAWIALKGGTPAASHGHMDVGSWVYDAHGSRWIHDLGADNYNLPGYFGGQRWDYFRLNSLSHNTLVIGGKLQNPKSPPCPVISKTRDGSWSAVAFDLTPAYRGQAKQLTRTVRFDHSSGTAVIRDEIEAPEGDVRWAAVTDADAEVKGADLTLRKKDGKTVTFRRVDKGGGEWQVADAKAPGDKEKSNRGFRMVTFTASKAGNLTLEVAIRP